MAVKLRTKKLKDGGKSFYLDIYLKGKRSYDFTGIKITKNDREKKQKKELAERIRSDREYKLTAGAYGIPNNYNGKEDFLKFYKDKCKDGSYKASFTKLKEFSENKLITGILPYNRIDEKFCEDYRDWLLTNDLPPIGVPVLMLYSPIKHWLPDGEVSPPVPEAQNLTNYAV